MRTEDLYYFQEVVACRSISHAAEKLYTSQQNVSRIIHALEKEFSITLFERHRRGVALTPAGEAFWQSGQELLKIYEQMQSLEAAHPQAQQTYATAIDPLCSRLFLPKLLQLASQYPEAAVQFLEESHAVPIFQKITARQYDFGLAIFSDDYLQNDPHYQKQYGRTFLTYPLAQNCLYALVRKDSPFADQENFDLEQLFLDKTRCPLAFDLGNRIYSYFSENIPTIKLNAVLKTSNLDAQIAYVKNAQAVSFIDGFSLSLLPEDDDIVRLPVRESRLTLAAFSALRWHSLPPFQAMLKELQSLLPKELT